MQNIFVLQARQLMQMWGSAFGDGATPEAMVKILQKIPIATDIVDRINKHCEWINIVFQALPFLHRHPWKRGSFGKEAKPGNGPVKFSQNFTSKLQS